MSSLRRALERSKAAWEAVGTPERARAVLRDDKRGIISNVSLATTTIDSINLLDLIGGKWRAIVPKVKYEPVGTLPVVGDFVVHVRSTGAVCDAPPDHKPALVTALHEDDDGIMNCLADDVFWAFEYFGNGDFRVLKRKVPKKAEDAGWPRYYVGSSQTQALVLRTATRGDGTHYGKVETRPAAEAWWNYRGGPDGVGGYNPVTPHQFAEWLYEFGHTEAAYKIEPMYEESPRHPWSNGDWGEVGGKIYKVTDNTCLRAGMRHIRRSRARRDAIAEIEGKLKALGDVK